MMRSMFSGVSSLRAHQLRMDVIGSNIANVNTVGYKASSVTFAEMYSQTLSGASSSTDSRGGTNPMQVGLGTTTASIAVNHTKGSIQRTDIATDLMVDGSGFFMVNRAPLQNHLKPGRPDKRSVIRQAEHKIQTKKSPHFHAGSS